NIIDITAEPHHHATVSSVSSVGHFTHSCPYIYFFFKADNALMWEIGVLCRCVAEVYATEYKINYNQFLHFLISTFLSYSLVKIPFYTTHKALCEPLL